MAIPMTLQSAKQKFDLRWTVLAAASVLLSSVSLMQLSKTSAALVVMTAVGILISGLAARVLLVRPTDPVQSRIQFHAEFRLVQRLRVFAAVGLIALGAAANHSNTVLLVVLASAMLWLVSVSSFLQIGARYAPAQARYFPYVQYLGDFWIAIFLAVWGADWMVVAGLLAVAAPTAMVAVSQRDPRLLPVVILSAAALFLFGIPPEARLFGLYLIATVALPAWSAHHLMVFAQHLRELTASASDVSATH